MKKMLLPQIVEGNIKHTVLVSFKARRTARTMSKCSTERARDVKLNHLYITIYKFITIY